VTALNELIDKRLLKEDKMKLHAYLQAMAVLSIWFLPQRTDLKSLTQSSLCHQEKHAIRLWHHI